RSRAHREQPPRVGHALQLVHAAVLELDPGAGDEVLHRLRDDDLPGARARCDPRGDVHGDAAQLVAEPLALARMDTGADVDAEDAARVLDRAGAPDGAGGPVERGHEAVAGAVDLLAAEALELAADVGVVALEELAPA